MRNKSFSAYILVVLTISLFPSCNEKENDPIIFILKPLELLITIEAENNIIFKLKVESESNLYKLTIKQQEKIDGTTILLDSTLNGNTLIYDFNFKAPALPDSAIINLVFTISDVSENSLTLARQVIILEDEILLAESTGHVMFSSLSGKYSAFSIDLRQPLSNNDHPDSLLHFADRTIDSIHLNTLSREWYSPAGFNFVRFQGFNYPTATQRKLQNAYDTGIKLTSVRDLLDDDIILLGKSDMALAAIYITQIIDADSTLNDKYIFSLKY
jgi:hypothetical protein